MVLTAAAASWAHSITARKIHVGNAQHICNAQGMMQWCCKADGMRSLIYAPEARHS
jgi:hypothetical protein